MDTGPAYLVDLRMLAVVEICADIAGHAHVAHRVHMIGRQPYFEYPVLGGLKEFTGGKAGLKGGIQYQDALMALAKADLVFRADHAVAVFSADLRFLHGQRLAGAGVYRGADGGYHYFLANGHIGSAANDAQRLAVADVHFGQSQLVRIGMLFHAQHFPYHQPFQAALDAFEFLQALHFKAYGGQYH